MPLPAPAQAEFSAVLQGLRSQQWPVRWVQDGSAHLTLKFFGEVVPSRLDVILEAVQRAVGDADPMTMRFTEVGAFPAFRHPRVLWLGLEAPPALALLKDRMERAAESIGFQPEGIPFQPHVTLGRLRDGQRIPRGAVESCGVAPAGDSFTAREVMLFESTLTPAGPRYVPRLSLELGT